MLRALRAISPTDLRNLNHDYLKSWLPLTRQIEYGPDVLGSLSRLASLGLVNEQFMRPDPNTSDQQKLASLLRLGTRRVFQLSPFGERFMLFVASHDGSVRPGLKDAATRRHTAREEARAWYRVLATDLMGVKP
jgi:hypothetical protein